VRRSKIPKVWPLMAAPDTMDADVRKFEEIGTHPAANHNAIAEALAFHNGIGVERRAARMRVLRDRWMRRLSDQPGARIFTSFDPAMSCGIGTVQIEGVDTRRLAAHLFDRRRIIVVPIGHEEFEGIRVTPNVYTTLDEVDLFAEEMEAVIARGLPRASASTGVRSSSPVSPAVPSSRARLGSPAIPRPSGRVTFHFVHSDHKLRLHPELLRAAASVDPARRPEGL
jgi:hypothetical protein